MSQQQSHPEETLAPMFSFDTSNLPVGVQTKSAPQTRSVSANSNAKELCVKGHCFRTGPFKIRSSVIKNDQTLRITCPGCYVLTEDYVFSPTQGDVAAIEIAANDVTLDLQCYTLSQGNTEQNVAGVLVLEGHENVTVKGTDGGAVKNFSQFGVRVEGGSSHITVSNLLLTGNGDSSETQPFVGTLFVEQPVVPGYTVGGLAIGNSSVMGLGDGSKLVHNVQISNVRSVRNYQTGAYLGNIDGLQVNDSLFNENHLEGEITVFFGFPPACAGVIGSVRASVTSRDSFENGVTNAEFKNCHFDKNQVRNSTLIFSSGLIAFGGGNVSFDSCTFNENSFENDQSVEDKRFVSQGAINWSQTSGYYNHFRCQFNGNRFISKIDEFLLQPGNECEIFKNTLVVSAGRDGTVSIVECEIKNNFADLKTAVRNFNCIVQVKRGLIVKDLVIENNVFKSEIFSGSNNPINFQNDDVVVDGLIHQNCQIDVPAFGSNNIIAVLNTTVKNSIVRNIVAPNGFNTFIRPASPLIFGSAPATITLLNNLFSPGNVDSTSTLTAGVNIQIDGNDTVLVKDNVFSNTFTGLRFFHAGEARSVLVKDNQFLANDVGLRSFVGALNLLGKVQITDNSFVGNITHGLLNGDPTNTFLIAKNTSFEDGASHADSFVTTPPVARVDGTINALPSTAGQELANISIRTV